ncbi:MAG: ABC transporter permease [Candidatus Aminicenantes bacterium]|nr:MAG: ABC transporter permease [Candidatus Aminicenantes bacterium]
MFKNYLRIILVNLKKHKAFSFINIVGLAIGIACCILITAYVLHELSYDKFHEKADRIYRLRCDLKISGDDLNIPKSSPPMAEYLVQNYPEVLSAVRFRRLGRVPVRYKESLYNEDRLFFADNSVFEVFTFPIIKGDPQSALKTAYSVVITEDMAKKYFGEEDPIGNVLNINNEYDFTVTGVVKNVPNNSHLTFDMLCSFETYAESNKRDMHNWLSINNYTYILLQEGYDYKQLEQKFPEMIKKHAGNALKYVKGEIVVSLQPLTSIHLHSNLMQEVQGNSSIVYVYIFAAIAIFILAIACINFMNLSTARSGNRAQEVGMRKVLGADRGKIIRQFLIESIFYSFMSLIVALLFVELTLPLFQSISGIELNIDYAENLWLIPSLIGLAVFVGLIAGSYPALFLSAFQPVRVLKGVFKAGTAKTWFRSVLVIVQFSISIVLIIATIVVFSQLNYLKNERLGFHKEQIVVIPISDESTLDSLRPLKEELKSHSGILSVAASSHVPGQTTYVNPFIPEGFSLDQMQYMGELYIDHDFIPTMDIEIAAGRNFSADFRTDIEQSILINETAAKKFGWVNPIGKTIREISMSRKVSKYTVIGVVKDFHMESLHKQISPLFIRFTTHIFNSLSVRISPENIPQTLSFLRDKTRQVDPHRPFEYTFLDDSFDAQYRAEERLSKIFSYFSVLAIFIACLGLFGLASFTAEQRTKEIGIRKVLGASVSGIVVLLSREFIKWVLIANAIAWPVSYLAMAKWLQNFAYRTAISPLPFIISFVLALIITFATISYQSLKAALANPVDSLRYE